MRVVQIIVGLFALCAVALSASAEAAVGLRFVASNGSDANSCSQTVPCRTLQRAVNLSSAGDEVHVLDTGPVAGNLTIAKCTFIQLIVDPAM